MLCKGFVWFVFALDQFPLLRKDEVNHLKKINVGLVGVFWGGRGGEGEDWGENKMIVPDFFIIKRCWGICDGFLRDFCSGRGNPKGLLGIEQRDETKK